MPRQKATPGAQQANASQGANENSGASQSNDEFSPPQTQEELDALINQGIQAALADDETIQGMIAAQVQAALARAQPKKQALSTDKKLPTPEEAAQEAQKTGRAVLSTSGYVTPNPPSERPAHIR